MTGQLLSVRTKARSAGANATYKTPHKTRFKTSIKSKIYPPQHPVGELNLSASCNRALGVGPKPLAPQMQVLGLNHFNITASPHLIEQVKRFYMDIVGLKIGSRAHLDHEGYWLYAGDSPILHLSARPNVGMPVQLAAHPGYFNHISLGCVGLKSAIAKLTATHTPYRLIELPDIKQTQLFVKDPAGIGVELTFFNERV